MDKLYFGDIILLNFPFSDGITYKKRPALLINEYNDGDIIVCRITSKIYTSENDIYLNYWEKCGLKLPSVIRVHKIATMEKSMVELLIGKISDETKESIKLIVSNLTKNESN